MSDIAQRLTAIGVAATDMPGGMVCLPSYPVHIGQHRGSQVDVAFVAIDLNFTPPAGINIRGPWVSSSPHVIASPSEANGDISAAAF